MFFLVLEKLKKLKLNWDLKDLKEKKSEAELDECWNEIFRLINTLRSCEDKMLQSQVRFSLNFYINYPIYFIQQRQPSAARKQKPIKTSAASDKQHKPVEKCYFIL